MFDVIAFDADDTLWHNESHYQQAQADFAALLADFISPDELPDRLYQTEMKNLALYGYGAKSFMLSMVETAVTVSHGRVGGNVVQQIIELGRQMLAHPVELLEHVPQTVAALAKSHRLMVITKGDLLDQESKLARSGIAHHFAHVEVVSHKNAAVYANLLQKYAIAPQRFLMVGNSLPSDVLPVTEIGGQGVHIPYHVTWQHEHAAGHPAAQNGYFELEHIGQLPDLLARLAGN